MPWVPASTVAIAVQDRLVARLSAAMTEETVRAALSGGGIVDQDTAAAAVELCTIVYPGEPAMPVYPSLYARVVRIVSTEEQTVGFTEYALTLEVVAATTTPTRDFYLAAALLAPLERVLMLNDEAVEPVFAPDGKDDDPMRDITAWSLEHDRTDYGIGADAAAVLGIARYMLYVTVDRTS